jgi:hypothetical protein
MVFELEADGVRVSCSSPFWTRKLVSKGAKLVDARQAEYLGGTDSPERHAPPAQPEPLLSTAGDDHV